MQPTFLINHGGGPCLFLEPGPMRETWSELETYLRGFMATLPETPRALLAIWGHWEERIPTLNACAYPRHQFDYGGFPDFTCRLAWPERGAPNLAARVRELLSTAGILNIAEPVRGWDHGVFAPLKLMIPEPDIPMVQLSLQRGLDPANDFAIGHALKPPRDEGVLILGSGQSTITCAASWVKL